jgi:hypothetical protein
MMTLHSIIVTDDDLSVADEHVLRHLWKFWIGTIAALTPCPYALTSAPAFKVTWSVDLASLAEGEKRVLDRNVFPLDARATADEALMWHLSDEAHWRQHG